MLGLDPPDLPIFDAFANPSLMHDPAPIFAAAHRCPGPGIFRNPNGEGLIATGYDTLSKLMRNPALQAQNRNARKSGPAIGGALAGLFDNHPVFMNEPMHKPVRQAAFRAVGRSGAEKIRSRIRTLAQECLEPILDRRHGDLAADYAFKISSRFWTDYLGLERCNADYLLQWTNSIGALMAFQPTEKNQQAANEAAISLWKLVGQHCHDPCVRGSHSSFHVVDSMLSKIELDNKPEDAAALLAAMTFDGIDGSGGMTANMLYCLLCRPNSSQQVRTNNELISGTWTEAVRYAPPILGLFRCPIENVEIDDIILPSGVNILMLYAAENRDPKTITNPDLFDIGRKEKWPLSFGNGPRACIGRGLAKIQGEVALEVLLDRTKTINLLDHVPDWGPPGLLRAIRKIPVEVAPC